MMRDAVKIEARPSPSLHFHMSLSFVQPDTTTDGRLCVPSSQTISNEHHIPPDGAVHGQLCKSLSQNACSCRVLDSFKAGTPAPRTGRCDPHPSGRRIPQSRCS